MATVKTFNFTMPENVKIRIGNNREIERKGNRIFCYLHGNNIVTIQEPESDCARFILDDCTYKTTTTRNAMQDFARAIGASLSVSFARKGFAIRYMGRDGEYNDCDSYYGQSFIARAKP